MTSIFKSTNKAEIAKKSNRLFKSSFRNLEPGTVYKDIMGWRTNQKVNALDDMWEEFEEAGIPQEFDELQDNLTFGQAVEEIQKNYDTGDWSLPIFHVPEVHVANPEQTPAADLIAREAVDQETINVTEETSQPDIEFGLETTDDTEGSYTYNDASYTDHSYDVYGYGVASRLEDKMILASNALRSTESVVEQAHVNGIRQNLERQILRGADANGWSGMTDLGTKKEGLDLTTDIAWDTKLRELINEVEYQGGDPGSIAVFTDFETYNGITADLTDYTRYETPGDELGFGFRTLMFDSVPVMKTHGIPKQANQTSSGDPVVIAADMSANYMAMLQDLTVKPLAKVGPEEQFATDAYGTFVSKDPDKIQYLASDGTLS